MEELKTIFEWLKKKVLALLGYEEKTPTQTPGTNTAQPSAPAAESAPCVERHHVAGISFREGAVFSLGTENPDFKLTRKQLIEDGVIYERVYKTDFFVKSCDLIPEPDNPADPKAIKVVVEGVHIGYIKKGSCAHIHKLLREGSIDRITCEIAGGPYKIIVTDYDEDGEEIYTLEKETAPIGATVAITLKQA